MQIGSRTDKALGAKEKRFPFLDLPPEIRIMIYRHIVPFDLVRISQIIRYPFLTWLELCDIMRGRALLHTSSIVSQSYQSACGAGC
jgi:hypothetical protein